MCMRYRIPLTLRLTNKIKNIHITNNKLLPLLSSGNSALLQVNTKFRIETLVSGRVLCRYEKLFQLIKANL